MKTRKEPAGRKRRHTRRKPRADWLKGQDKTGTRTARWHGPGQAWGEGTNRQLVQQSCLWNVHYARVAHTGVVSFRKGKKKYFVRVKICSFLIAIKTDNKRPPKSKQKTERYTCICSKRLFWEIFVFSGLTVLLEDAKGRENLGQRNRKRIEKKKDEKKGRWTSARETAGGRWNLWSLWLNGLLQR